VGCVDDELEHRGDGASVSDSPQQACCAVCAQKLRWQVDEFCLAARVLQWPLKHNVVGDQVLPLVPMRIESRVVALDHVLCVCMHAHIDQPVQLPPSVVPAKQHSLPRSAATAGQKVSFC